MAAGQAGILLHHLRGAVTAGAADRLPDADLVRRFAAGRDEAAFAALVRRHGPMVLRVARRVMHDGHDAEEVFQATFLVLARKAAGLRRDGSLGSWLYGVAYRLARQARAAAARRRTREGAARPPRPADPAAAAALRDALAALDEELARLPEKYRAPLVLCCLEGRARDEAARQLGWPAGVVKSRLEQARERLRRRLALRGLSLPGALAAALLAEGAAEAVPPALLAASVRTAATVAAGIHAPASVSAGALRLAGGARLLTPARLGAFALLVTVAGVAGSYGLLGPQAPPAPAEARPQPPAAEAKAAPPAARADRFGDPLPEGALVRFGTVRFRDGGGTNSAALSPDGTTLATASEHAITLWDLATGRPRHRLYGADIAPCFSPNQTFVCFSPDGKRLASLGGWDADRFPVIGRGSRKTEPALHVWDTATGKEVGRYELLGGTKLEHYLPAQAVWFTPDGKEIGVMLQSGVVRYVYADTGGEARHFATGPPLREDCPGIAPSPSGKLLAVIDPRDDKALRLFDAATGREVRRIAAPAGLENVAFSPDSALLAVADQRSVIRLYEAATGKAGKAFAVPVPAREKSGPRTGVGFLTALTFGPDGKAVYAGTKRGQILRWRLPGGEALPTLTADDGPDTPGLITRWATGIFLPPEGRTLVSVGWGSGTVRRLDLADGQEIPSADGFRGGFHARLSPDRRLVAAGDGFGRLELFDAATGRPARLLRATGPTVSGLCWSPDGRTLAAGQTNNEVTLWDPAGVREPRALRLPVTGRTYSASHLAFSPDGGGLLVAHNGVWLLDVASGAKRWHQAPLRAVVLSGDGKAAAAAGLNHTLVLLDPEKGAARASHRLGFSGAGGEFLLGLAFAPDGSCLASSHADGTIVLRDPRGGEERTRLHGPEGVPCGCVAFSPDGRWLLSGWADRQVRLWEVATGKEVLRLGGHEGRVSAVEFGSDLRTVLSASGDKTALLWGLRPPGVAARPGGAAGVWDDLASDDAARAYRALWALADAPAPASAVLLERMPPARPADEARARQLVAGLDADAFAERERAARELAAMGPAVVPVLKKVLAEGGTPEARRRVQGLVDELTQPGRKDFRRLRAVQALELAGTPEAREVLTAWADGQADAPLTRDARAALDRLARLDRLRHGSQP
jgi:RNA polymerase sigma factor (sigma-70 family)